MLQKLKNLKKLFFKTDNSTEQDTNTNTNTRKSSIIYRDNNRYLLMKNDDCALILHNDNQVEVVFTKYYKENQDITPNEDLLMALAIYLKQPGFGEMLISEFHRIAMKNSKMFEENNKESIKTNNKENKEKTNE